MEERGVSVDHSSINNIVEQDHRAIKRGFCRIVDQTAEFSRHGTLPLKQDGSVALLIKRRSFPGMAHGPQTGRTLPASA